MAKNGFKVFDADLHVREPTDLWVKYMEPKYRDRAPVGTTKFFMDLFLEHDGRLISKMGHCNVEVEGEQTEKMSEDNGRMALYRDYDRRGWGPDVQIEAMDREGVDMAVLYPSRGLFALAKEYDDDDLAAAIARAYNNWLAEFCSHAPDRMYGAALLPVEAPAAAVAEAKRAKEELDFKAVFIRPNPVGGRNWHDKAYDPLWAECEKQGLTVGFHEGPAVRVAGAHGRPVRRRVRGHVDDRTRGLPPHRADVRLPLDDQRRACANGSRACALDSSKPTAAGRPSGCGAWMSTGRGP